MPRSPSIRCFWLLALALLLGAPAQTPLSHAAKKGRKRPSPRTKKAKKKVIQIKKASKVPKVRVRPLPRLAEPSPLAVGRYAIQLHNKIQRHWSVQGIPLMELHRRSATVQLWIKANGTLRRVKVESSSGLKKFDSSLTAAIAAAQPLPKPGPAIRAWVHYYGVEVFFRKRVFRRKTLPINKTYKGKTVLYDWQKRKAALPQVRKAPPRRRPASRK